MSLLRKIVLIKKKILHIKSSVSYGNMNISLVYCYLSPLTASPLCFTYPRFQAWQFLARFLKNGQGEIVSILPPIHFLTPLCPHSGHGFAGAYLSCGKDRVHLDKLQLTRKMGRKKHFRFLFFPLFNQFVLIFGIKETIETSETNVGLIDCTLLLFSSKNGSYLGKIVCPRPWKCRVGNYIQVLMLYIKLMVVVCCFIFANHHTFKRCRNVWRFFWKVCRWQEK